MEKKSILIFADWYEPGYKAGGPIQSCRNFVEAMHELYTISVLTSDRDLGDTNTYPGIQTNQWSNREPGIQVYYAAPESLKSRLIRDLIESKDPDFIYLNSMYSYWFSIVPMILLWRKRINTRIILAPRGMLQAGALKFKPLKKKLFISLLNAMRIPTKIYFHATDQQEKKDILQQFPKAGKVEVIPNFSGEMPANVNRIEKLPGNLRCIYISRIIPKKNILFFLKLINMLPDDIDFEFSIYGEVEDERYWNQAKKVMHFLPKNIAVLYQGPLPHDHVNPCLEANHVFVLPSKGENFGHAIFESFSAGRPVLISDKTPWRGLQEKQVGWDIPLDYPEAWLAALQEAADAGQAVFDVWSAKCRQFAQDHQGRPDLKDDYIKLFN